MHVNLAKNRNDSVLYNEQLSTKNCIIHKNNNEQKKVHDTE